MKGNTAGLLTRSLMLVLLAGAALGAQSKAQEFQSLEGQTVAVKIDMPGTQLGVDVYPGREQPLDFKTYSQRLKEYGAALRAGDEVMITKVKVKGDHIEVQLGGGGYGTIGDDTDTDVFVPDTRKSRREKDLDEQLKDETDPRERKKLREKVDDLKDQRERRDDENRAIATDASVEKQAMIDERRLQGGSRFNIRYEKTVPAEALTPETMMAALARYVKFPKRS